MTAARNRAINELHRQKRVERKHGELGRELAVDEQRDPAPELAQALDDDVGDDLLRLVFIVLFLRNRYATFWLQSSRGS